MSIFSESFVADSVTLMLFYQSKTMKHFKLKTQIHLLIGKIVASGSLQDSGFQSFWTQGPSHWTQAPPHWTQGTPL